MPNKMLLGLFWLFVMLSGTAVASSCDGISVHIFNKSSSDLLVKNIENYVDKGHKHESFITLNQGEIIGKNEERIVTVHSAFGTHGNVAGDITLSSKADPSHEVSLHYKATQWFPWYCDIKKPTLVSTSPYHFLAAQLADNNRDIEYYIHGY